MQKILYVTILIWTLFEPLCVLAADEQPNAAHWGNTPSTYPMPGGQPLPGFAPGWQGMPPQGFDMRPEYNGGWVPPGYGVPGSDWSGGGVPWGGYPGPGFGSSSVPSFQPPSANGFPTRQDSNLGQAPSGTPFPPSVPGTPQADQNGFPMKPGFNSWPNNAMPGQGGFPMRQGQGFGQAPHASQPAHSFKNQRRSSSGGGMGSGRVRPSTTPPDWMNNSSPNYQAPPSTPSPWPNVPTLPGIPGYGNDYPGSGNFPAPQDTTPSYPHSSPSHPRYPQPGMGYPNWFPEDYDSHTSNSGFSVTTNTSYTESSHSSDAKEKNTPSVRAVSGQPAMGLPSWPGTSSTSDSPPGYGPAFFEAEHDDTDKPSK